MQPLSFDEDWQEEHKLSENISSSTISVRRSQPFSPFPRSQVLLTNQYHYFLNVLEVKMRTSKHLKLRSRERVVSKKVNFCLSRERRPYSGPTCTRKDVAEGHIFPSTCQKVKFSGWLSITLASTSAGHPTAHPLTSPSLSWKVVFLRLGRLSWKVFFLKLGR